MRLSQVRRHLSNLLNLHKPLHTLSLALKLSYKETLVWLRAIDSGTFAGAIIAPQIKVRAP